MNCPTEVSNFPVTSDFYEITRLCNDGVSCKQQESLRAHTLVIYMLKNTLNHVIYLYNMVQSSFRRLLTNVARPIALCYRV